MADPELLVIVKRGVQEWNQWRLAHPLARKDLREADLADLDLRGARFDTDDLRGGKS